MEVGRIPIQSLLPETQVPDERVAECRVPENRVRLVVSSLVSSVYVHPRSSAFTMNVAVQVADVNGIRRTVIQTPENRKVGGSTPPLATTAQYKCSLWFRLPNVCPEVLADLAGHVPLRFG